MDNQEVPE